MKNNSINEKKLNESVKKIFATYGKLSLFKKNSFIFMKDESPKGAYLVETGLVKICQLTEKGQNITFFIRKAGDAFAFAEIILKQNHPCYAQALQDCKIWTIDKNIIEEKMKNDINLNNDILYLMTSRLIHQQNTVELLTSKDVKGRLVWLLEQISSDEKNGELTIDRMLTHEEISNIIGCSRQTVTEILNEWKREGKIDYNRKEFIIKKELR